MQKLKRKLKSLIAIEIIIAMTLYYFVYVGNYFVSYAIDMVATNNSNVEFMSFFLNTNKEKVQTINVQSGQKEKLYINISVKNEGYFNGKIVLDNANFEIEKEESESIYISEIKSNEVILNQINAGTTATIVLIVKAIENSKIDINMLKGKTQINLEGRYINGKSIEKEKSIEIKGINDIALNWITNNNFEAELQANVITNGQYNINGEIKNLVQLEIISKLTNNNYPVKDTTIELQVPSEVEEVEVYSRSTKATNNNINFSQDNYIYNKEEGRLIIKILNENEKQISWEKDAEDILIVTYTLKGEIASKDIQVVSTLKTYDNEKKQAQKQVHIEEKIDGIVTTEIIDIEKEVYKGKIYAGEEREYNENIKVNVNYLGIAQNINVDFAKSLFLIESQQIDANITFKQMRFNKDEFLKIVGENGFLNIKANNQVIATFSKDSEIDENGDIIVSIDSLKQDLEMELSEPICVGTMSISLKKVIEKNNITGEKINKLEKIKNEVLVGYNRKITYKKESNINLLNTSSNVEFSINAETLTSKGINENVKMVVALKNNDESKDLFKNPSITITFPENVRAISDENAKCNVLHGNGLDLETAKITKINGKSAIQIQLKGEQKNYNKDIIEGTTLSIYLNIEVDKSAESGRKEILLNYTNENAINYQDNAQKAVQVNIEVQPEEEINQNDKNEINTYNLEQSQANIEATLKAYVGGEEIKDGDIVYAGEVIEYKLRLRNIGNLEARNINVKIEIPQNTQCVEFVKDSRPVMDEQLNVVELSKDHYEKVDIINNVLTNNIDKISINDEEIIAYSLKIDEDISEQKINTDIIVMYKDVEDNNFNLEIKNPNLNAKSADVCISLYMRGRGNTGFFYDGTSCIFDLEVKNLSLNKLKNIEVALNNIKGLQYRKILDANLKEVQINNNKFSIDSLDKGETKIYSFYLDILNESAINLAFEANKQYRSNYIEEKVQITDILTSIESNTDGQEVKNGEKIIYNINIKNNGNFIIENLFIEQKISIYLDIENITINGKAYDYNRMENNEPIYYNNDYKGLRESRTYSIGIDYDEKLDIGESIQVKVETISSDEYKHSNVIHLVSSSSTEVKGRRFYAGEINNLLVANYKTEIDKEDDDFEQDKDDDEDSTGSDSKDESDDEIDRYTISGTAWLDENKNGQKESSEKRLANIDVMLADVETNKIIATTKTTNNGFYSFTNLVNGVYIVLFKYDIDKYMLTTYQINDVDENKNSDFEDIEANINGVKQNLAASNTLKVDGKGINNLDIGLVELKIFDLKLDKAVSKITVSNDTGTKVEEYNDVDLAKTEIKAKYLKGSIVVIEYKISVTNEGELAGYAKEIVDYKPNDLEFNSSLNSDWYQSGEYIYTKALANTKIKPGETKELKLILTKIMTESNTGLVNNMAEIKETSNMLGIEDKDSTPLNKHATEDDIDFANVIIGVSTGAMINYMIMFMSMIVIVAITVYIISKKILKHN